MTVMIQAEGLSRRYGAVQAVDNVSFRIKRGEVIGLLGLQLLLGAALNLGSLGTANKAETLKLGLSEADTDRIEITSKDGQSVKLVRQDGHWKLPDYHQLPASAEGVKVLFERLGKLEGGVPVATSSEARKRFSVDESNFERRISFFHGANKLGTVYLGSPGSRNRSHLRLEGSDGIFEEAIALYEINTNQAAWADKNLLKVPGNSIERIALGELSLLPAPKETPATNASEPAASAPTANAAHTAANWRAESLPPGQQLKSAAASKLAEQLANLSFESVLGDSAESRYGLDKPMLSLHLTRKPGEVLEYRLGKLENEEAYALQRSDQKVIFKLLPYQAQPLLDAAKPEHLIER